MNKVPALFIVLVLSLGVYLAKGLTVDICKNQPDGSRLAHPADCTKFVVCRQRQTERILTCPLGLHFNRIDSICDMRERAACDAKFVKPTLNNAIDCSSCSSGCDGCVDIPTPAREGKVSRSVNNKANIGNSVGPSTGPSGTTCVNSGKCIAQPDGTMFADPNTDGYIVCQCECQIEMPCAPGTKFDESLRTCNHKNGGANDKNCSNPGKCAGQPNGAIFPNPNTNTGYLQCQSECEVVKSCAPGTIFNEIQATCVNANSGSGGICETSGIKCTNPGKCAGKPNGTILPASNATTFTVCICQCELIRSCAPDTIFQENLNVCVHLSGPDGNCGTSGITCKKPGKCASQPDGAIFANPKTNTGYIECRCECELEKPCVSGTIFNEALKFCVHVNGGGGLNGDDKTGGTSEAGGNDCSTSKVQCNNPGKCSSQPDGAIFANPNTTIGYIECLCECELEKLCVRGTIFNEALKFCIHVNGGGGLNGDDKTSGTSAAGGIDCDTSRVQCNSPGKCSRQPDGAIFANPNTTIGYIECLCGCELEKPCVRGTIFNEALKFCVHVNGGGGLNGDDKTGGTSEAGGNDCSTSKVQCNNPGKCSSQPDGAIFANPNTTIGYIECLCECELEKLCVRGTIFNEALKFCIHVNGGGGLNGDDKTSGTSAAGGIDCDKSKIQCNNPGKCANQPDGAVFANPNTTTGYIECLCGCELEKPCLRGTIFNEALKFCIHVNGGGGLNGDDETGGTSEADGNDCSTSKFQCNNPGKCANQPDGAIFANPNTTIGYIECLCECELEKLCVRGTIFNEGLNSCIHVNGGGGLNGDDKTSGTSAAGGIDCDTSRVQCNSPGKCSRQPDGAIFANPNTTTGYIECLCGCELEKPCVRGTIFNEALKFCVHVNSGGDVNGDDKTGGTSEAGGNDCSTSKVQCNNPGKCSSQPDGAIFANPNTTIGYIECLCECELEKLCVRGTIFNEALKFCIHVNGGGGLNGDDKTSGTSAAGGIDCDTSRVQCNSPGKCSRQPDGAIFANPNTTIGYIECLCGCELEKPCVRGTIFNEALKFCVHVNSGGDINGDDKTGGTSGASGNDCSTSKVQCNNPGKCASQPNGAIFANPNTTTGYIECLCGCELEKLCVRGTIFNEALKFCVHVNSGGDVNGDDKTGGTSEAGGNGCSTSKVQCNNPGKCANQPDGAIFDNPNTTTGYIECLCGCELEKPCVRGTIFNEALKFCVHVNGGGGINGDDKSGGTSGASGNDCSTSKVQCNNPGKCASQPNGAIFANPNTTTGYIECLCGCELEKLCVRGTIFNEALKFCVHVNSGGDVNGDDKTGDTSKAGGNDCSTSKAQCKKPGKCANQPDGAIFANPNTTTGYIECICGCELEKLCVRGTIFNEALKFCVHVNSGGDVNGDDKTGDTSKAGGNDCSTSKAQCKKPGKCANQPDGAIFANPNTTTGYIECICGCELEKLCVRGTIFNEALKFCVHVNSGGDVNGDDKTGDTSKAGGNDCSTSKAQCKKPGKCANQPDGAIFANPNTTTGYIECICGCELEKLCVRGTIFNEALKFCVHVNSGGDVNGDDKTGDTSKAGGNDCSTSKAQCKKPGKCANQPDGAIFANPNTTTGYIECLCECELEKLCVRGTIFNEVLKFCVHVNGGGDINDDKTGGTSGASGNDCSTSKVQCNDPGKCASQPDGAIFANPNTTTGYIECLCGCELEKLCVRGTIFNEALKFCIHVNGGGGLNGDDNTGGTSEAGGTDCDTSKVQCNNSGKCARQLDGAIFTNPNTTTGYIECRCECEMEKSCLPGSIFNEALKLCIHVDGSEGGNVIGSEEGSGSNVDPGNEGGNSNTENVSAGGDTGGEEGSSGTEVGGNMSGCGLCKSPGKCIDKPDGTTFAYSNATGYIVCMCGCEIDRSCAPGTIFNETLTICIPIDCVGADKGVAGSGCNSTGPVDTSNAGGTGEETNTNSGGGSASGIGETGHIESGTGGNSNAGINGPSTGPSGTACVNSGKCAQQPDGAMYRDPNSTGYIVCQCECEVKMLCAPGTAFSEILKTCDHIKSK